LRAARAAALSALLASLLAAAGCYKPNIKPGALICATGSTPCPENFKCASSNNRCYPNDFHFDAGTTGGTGGTGGMGGAATGAGGNPVGGAAGGPDGGTPTCLAPVANCSSIDAGLCDPVCNTGCAKCNEKCSVDPNGDLTCNPLSPPGNPVGILGLCAPSQGVSSDPTTRSDNCQPGSACINHNVCGNRCYQICRKNSDCQPNASCSIDAGGGNSFCDVPTMKCDPVQGASTNPVTSGCPAGNQLQSCYLSSDTGTTVCDCYQAGVSKGQPCVHARDCFPGLTCYDPFGRGNKLCYKVCRLPSPDGGADLTRTDAGEQPCSASACSPILLSNQTVSTVYGVCPE